MSGAETSLGVGILGGSFNPVHRGHVALARELQRRCRFDPLWVVPAGRPPHKNAVGASAEHRLAMARLAFADVDGARVSSFEAESREKSYSLRTIELFRRQDPRRPLFFVVGADAFHEIHKWYAFPDVMESCHYIVTPRPGWETPSRERLASQLAKMSKAGLLTEAGGSGPQEPLRALLAGIFRSLHRTRSGTFVCVLDAELPEISSTEIRARVQLGEGVADLVPEAVARYLMENRVYDK